MQNEDEVTRILELAQQIARIEQLCVSMNHRLFGNGQPGEIDKLKDDMTSMKSSRSWVKGVVATLTALVSIEGGIHIRNLFKP